ncbi:MAG: ISL3 family transposase [Cyanobacteria bacterium J06623_7]
MQFLQCLLPSSTQLHLDSCDIDQNSYQLTLSVSSTQTTVPSPLCGTFTQRVHSRYQRTITDLPCVDFRLRLLVQVCKFFCPNPDCHRRIFTERIPAVVAPWDRKTIRLVQRLQSIGLALGGAAAARLGHGLGYFDYGSSILNQLQRLSLPTFETPTMLGVNDFAFQKGHTYGTILVNLETHQPIALLADRKAETLADWLKAHPGIEVLSRDRSKTYKKAMEEGTPGAIQVADRFHSIQKLKRNSQDCFVELQSRIKSS